MGKRQNFPFAIQTHNEKDFVVGRVLKFDDGVFDAKVARANKINGYDPSKEEKDNYYQQVVVDAHVQEYSTGLQMDKVKALSWIQLEGKTPLPQCVEVPFSDWMKRHSQKLSANDGN